MQKLFDIEKSERLSYLKVWLKEVIGKHFHITDPNDLPNDESFFELGLSSLGAVEIKYELEKSLSIALDSTVIFNFPTIAKLSEFLSTQKLAFLFDLTQETVNSPNENEKEYAKQMLQHDFNL